LSPQKRGGSNSKQRLMSYDVLGDQETTSGSV
jgi:hypothetical protein